MAMSATGIVRSIRRLVEYARVRRRARPAPRCASYEVRSENDILTCAAQHAPPWEGVAAVLPSLLRDLVALNTPALFLNIIDGGAPVHVMLRPWPGRSVRFRGSSYLVEAGSEAPEGMEAFTGGPFSHVTALYPTVPDHPVYMVSIERQDARLYTGEIPSYLTHVTIMVNGRLVAHCERLLHERGPQVWRAA
jgi:hypothetical protein